MFKVGDRVIFDHWGTHGRIAGTITTIDPDGTFCVTPLPKYKKDVEEYRCGKAVDQFECYETYNSPLAKVMRELE